MIQLLTIIGARPQIIKAAAFSRAVAAWNVAHSPEEQLNETILHTGQHYDENMSAVFFSELGVPAPTIQLHAHQTIEMLDGIEKSLQSTHYDGVVLYGDTNSTLAGAKAASKLHVPVFHVEAGLRSWNIQMPEEYNRIVADSVASLLFTPTDTATANLQREGKDHIIQTGDLMYDNALYFSTIAEQKSDILHRLNLTGEPFVLTTIHRQSNADSPWNMMTISVALNRIAEQVKVILPLHPRTRANLTEETLGILTSNPQIILTEPVSFLDMVQLEKNATIVLTDSGGVQKEAFFFGKPCVILRDETEWVEIVDCGAAILAGADSERIVDAYNQLLDKTIPGPSQLYGNGHAAEQMVREIVAFLKH